MPVDPSLGGDENVSSQLPKSDAEAEFLKPAIADLLRTIPETWAEFDQDALSAIQARALFLLTAAGMVERRGWIRSMFANHPTYFEFRFQSSGEQGFVHVMEKVSAIQYETWRDAWQAWSVSDTRDSTPFHSVEIKPQEWRLSDQGADAQRDLSLSNTNTDSISVFNFVMKRGLFGPGYWLLRQFGGRLSTEDQEILDRHMAAGHDLSRLPRTAVMGSGQLVEFRKFDQQVATQSVNIANWSEGANAFADAFAKSMGTAFESLTKSPGTDGSDKAKSDDAAPRSQESPPVGNAERKPRLAVIANPPQAILDGTAYAVTPDAVTFLHALLVARGEWVGPKAHGVRTNRVIKGLPKEIRSLIETAGAKGARLKLD